MHGWPRPNPTPKASEPARVEITNGGGARRLGPHEVLVRLAAGGAANVFLVRDSAAPPPGRLLALKVLLPSLAANDDFLNMFFTEARIAAKLRHPNVVAITGFGQNEGIHCLAMEYVFGASLSQVLKQSARVKKPLTVGVLLQVTATVCDALHFAHELVDDDNKSMGLVHRDVTPQNILIGFNGVPKLTDFGIAKATGRGWETQAGIVKGKFSYMSPEQALGKKVDRRSDIFCTGIVLWEALTGKELFKGTSPMEVIEAIREQPIVPPSKVVPGLSPIVDPIVMKALRRSPRARYQTAAEMKQEIENLIDRAGVKIDAQIISKELAEIFGDTIVERAFALRAAMAGRADLDELAKALGAQRLRDEHLPVIEGGANNPDPLGLFSEQPNLDDVEIEEGDEEQWAPARAEGEFTRAFQAIDIEIEEPAPTGEEAAIDRMDDDDEDEEELLGFDFGEATSSSDGEGDSGAVEGWEDHTRAAAPSDELLDMLSEADATIGMIPSKFAERLGIQAAGEEDAVERIDEVDRTDTGLRAGGVFDDEMTMDASRPGLLEEPFLPPVRSFPPPARGDFDHAPPTVPGAAVVLKATAGSRLVVDSIAPAGSRNSQRPIPRAPSLDMGDSDSLDAATPLPELEPPPARVEARSEAPSISMPPPAPRRLSTTGGKSAVYALPTPLPAQSSELPPVAPTEIDEPEELRSSSSMPGVPAIRASSVAGRATAGLGDMGHDGPRALQPSGPPELSPAALRELIADGTWGHPQTPSPMPTPSFPAGVQGEAIRMRPAGLIALAALFIVVGVALGVVLVKFLL
ncbi:MAG: protein kinase [Myxococcota bacterium]